MNLLELKGDEHAQGITCETCDQQRGYAGYLAFVRGVLNEIDEIGLTTKAEEHTTNTGHETTVVYIRKP